MAQGAGGLAVGILGPFEVLLDGGGPVALGGPRQRALLAVLALHSNQVVSSDRLVDQLWGEHPPSDPLHTVQVFVSRLRRSLGAGGGRLITRRPGYQLELGADELDSERYEQIFTAARAALTAADPGRAVSLLAEGEALWRGPPLAEFTYEPFAQAAIARLEELRSGSREELVEAELALGRHAKVVPDLEMFVREQPFRERPRAQLMLALYRCGRQADALDVFQQARQTLVEELAVEPGSALRQLEEAILRQDPALELASPVPPPTLVGRSAAVTTALAPVGPVTPVPEPAAPGFLRKTGTVMVARLSVPEAMDTETARTVVARGRTNVEEIVGRHGGVVVSGLGGEVMAVFGVPVTREDDALRALRVAAALQVDPAVADATGSASLAVRVGVDSGEVVAHGPDDLFGSPLDGGGSLARLAGAGEVLLSPSTHRQVANAVRVGPTPDGHALLLLGFIDAAPLVPRQLGSPMVGREAELRAARAAFEQAVQRGDAHLLSVIGDAGIGKSRLTRDLTMSLEGEATILTGRCLSYGDGVALWPLRDAIGTLAGGESREAIRGLLGDAPDADTVADIVAAALGLADVESVGEQVPWALRRLLEVLATERPLMLVIDDAHWAEPPLLDLVDHLVDWLTVPVLILCMGRPDLLELRPRWGGGHLRMASLLLVPLAAGEARQLLDNQLGETSLSPTIGTQILDTAEGNPLFVEQLLAMHLEDPTWHTHGEIPATLQSLLSARLDRLGPGERAFIECAALIGREFWASAVVELLPPPTRPSAQRHLDTLVRRGLVSPARGPSTLAGEPVLRFHHILICDIAYRGAPKAVRAQLHERFADWLIDQHDRVDEFAGYHLEQAFRYRCELDERETATDLAHRGAGLLAAAGRRALSVGDITGGLALLTRSVGLAADAGRPDPENLLELGSALGEQGEFRQAQAALEAALELAVASGAEALEARTLIELSYLEALVDPASEIAEMLAVADRAIAVFTRLRDDGGLSRAWHHVAEVHWTRLRCGEMETVLERALRHAGAASERRQRSRILADLARATVIGPRPAKDGIARCRSILDQAGDDVPLAAVTATMLAVLEAMVGQVNAARDRWQAGKRSLDEVGLTMTGALMQMYCAFIELLAGSPARAVPEVSAAYSVLEGAGETRRLATTAALLARLLFAGGDREQAAHFSLVARQNASKDDVVSLVLWKGTEAKLLAHAGHGGRAQALVTSGVTLAAQTDFLVLHADALCERAEVFTLLERPGDAITDLTEAITVYERKGSSAGAAAARSTLGRLRPSPYLPSGEPV